ncbi:MAG TPA: serine/threonine-protein kinase, partial [Vicinamibacterales bacterium]|nr:serine/threonine-protein kinase [Vicinamibacterales bacterium]
MKSRPSTLLGAGGRPALRARALGIMLEGHTRMAQQGGALRTGARLGPYTVVSRLGSGGMGEVLRARDERLGREVALKVVHPRLSGPEAAARFEREARLLASLAHPHVATIFGFEEADGVRFAVLELVEGQTLRELLAGGPVAVERALRLAIQIADALEAAHARHIAHRDLKPENVKVTPDGRVKVLDFGIAQVIDAN